MGLHPTKKFLLRNIQIWGYLHYFLAQAFPALVIKSSFRLDPVFFWKNPIYLGAFPYFLTQETTSNSSCISCSTSGTSHFSTESQFILLENNFQKPRPTPSYIIVSGVSLSKPFQWTDLGNTCIYRNLCIQICLHFCIYHLCASICIAIHIHTYSVHIYIYIHACVCELSIQNMCVHVKKIHTHMHNHEFLLITSDPKYHTVHFSIPPFLIYHFFTQG